MISELARRPSVSSRCPGWQISQVRSLADADNWGGDFKRRLSTDNLRPQVFQLASGVATTVVREKFGGP